MEVFLKNCLHYLVTSMGEVIPRPLASALHGISRKEVVHMDYLYMGKADDADFKYVLNLRDALISVVWLFPTATATADAACDAIQS